jgi:hypothetical protein
MQAITGDNHAGLINLLPRPKKVDGDFDDLTHNWG